MADEKPIKPYLIVEGGRHLDFARITLSASTGGDRDSSHASFKSYIEAFVEGERVYTTVLLNLKDALTLHLILGTIIERLKADDPKVRIEF